MLRSSITLELSPEEQDLIIGAFKFLRSKCPFHKIVIPMEGSWCRHCIANQALLNRMHDAQPQASALRGPDRAPAIPPKKVTRKRS